ncbi:heparin lyase I family protein [uncultured Zobellia sp.]|uniref:heparin lyase I family protein n=1 Tax=uncultured Zobellia sp. TaxID=255433 RepID=UPI0025997E72|nr:heparin lyase I family protein [uncultured Zobellia sp.]
MANKSIKIGLLALCIMQVLACSKDTSLQQNQVQIESREQILPTDDLLPTNAEKSNGSKYSCSTSGGFANVTGLKYWCWEDAVIPDYTGKKGVAFSDGYLHVDSECYEKQVVIENDKIKFNINPGYPLPDSWCSRDYNMRAEIRTSPWDVRHELGTEEWFGWTYTFGENYIIDRSNQWLFFQVHPGVTGMSPHTELLIIKDDQVNGHNAGEIFVINSPNEDDYQPTGITPRAGETLSIVIHAIWGDENNGLLQVWINGQNIYDKQVPTVYKDYPWGGNAKWGIYKWPWAESEGVELSKNQGISNLETFMGPLRMITRKPEDSDYGSNSYALVSPD